MKIYIAGKITGLPRLEYLANFAEAERVLRDAGWEPVNPCLFGIPEDAPLHVALPVCKPELEQCVAIYLLHNWEDSPGARIELSWAKHLNMKVYKEKEHPFEVMKQIMQEVA